MVKAATGQGLSLEIYVGQQNGPKSQAAGWSHHAKLIVTIGQDGWHPSPDDMQGMDRIVSSHSGLEVQSGQDTPVLQ